MGAGEGSRICFLINSVYDCLDMFCLFCFDDVLCRTELEDQPIIKQH